MSAEGHGCGLTRVGMASIEGRGYPQRVVALGSLCVGVVCTEGHGCVLRGVAVLCGLVPQSCVLGPWHTPGTGCGTGHFSVTVLGNLPVKQSLGQVLVEKCLLKIFKGQCLV